jgi:hypothetical protein
VQQTCSTLRQTCPTVSNRVQAKRPTEQGKYKNPQVGWLRPNGLIIRWSLVRVQPAPQTESAGHAALSVVRDCVESDRNKMS